MIQQRSLSLLSSAERQLLRQNRRQATQCLRCFHSSKPTLAEEKKPKGNDNGTPYNAPKRGPNRQERAAKVSSEVSALAADLPKANLKGRNAEVDGAQPKRPGVSPQAQGKNVGPGRMGENDGSRKEGPFAQGVGRVVSEGEDPTTSKQARGIRDPNGRMETPVEGGASVMEPLGATPEAPVSAEPNAGTAETPIPAWGPASTEAPAQETQPSFSLASNTSTLLANSYTGIIQDRANLLSPRSSPATPTNAEIAHRLRHNKKQLTAFRNTPEKDSYLEPRQELKKKLRKLTRDLEKEKEANGSETALAKELVKEYHSLIGGLKKTPAFKPLPETTQQSIINRMVLGKYDEQGLLSGKQVHRQPLLNSVARELLRNSTYLAKDSEKLLSKLRGLLPAAAAPAAAKKPAAQKA